MMVSLRKSWGRKIGDVLKIGEKLWNFWKNSSGGERWNRTPEVAGSNPAASTKLFFVLTPTLQQSVVADE